MWVGLVILGLQREWLYPWLSGCSPQIQAVGDIGSIAMPVLDCKLAVSMDYRQTVVGGEKAKHAKHRLKCPAVPWLHAHLHLVKATGQSDA